MSLPFSSFLSLNVDHDNTNLINTFRQEMKRAHDTQMQNCYQASSVSPSSSASSEKIANRDLNNNVTSETTKCSGLMDDDEELGALIDSELTKEQEFSTSDEPKSSDISAQAAAAAAASILNDSNLTHLIRTLFETKNKEVLQQLHEYHVKKDRSQREKLVQLKDYYNAEIKRVKQKQWCAVCLRESNYHCCWNTSYCSENCQLIHWRNGHIKTCTRAQERESNDDE